MRCKQNLKKNRLFVEMPELRQLWAKLAQIDWHVKKMHADGSTLHTGQMPF
jgi:hypothetical protein